MLIKMTDEQVAVLVAELSHRLASVNLKKVSRETGVSYPVITDIKQKHRTKFSPSTLAKVAAYFGIGVQYEQQ